MKRSILLPRIFSQEGDTCYAYALAGLMELKYKIMGRNVLLDVETFYKDAKEWYRVTYKRPFSADGAFEYAKRYGFNSGAYKVLEVKRIRNLDIWLDNTPYYVVVDTERGEKLGDRLDSEYRLTRRTGGFHALIKCEKVDNHLSLANSWGNSWGDRGYFWLPRVQHKIIKEVYDIII